MADKLAKHPNTEGTDVRTSRDGNLVAVGASQRNGRLHVVDLRGTKTRFDVAIKASYIPAVDFAKDGRSVYCAAMELTQHDIKTGKTVRKTPLPNTALAMRISQDGKLLAVATADSKVRIYQLVE